MRYYAALDVGLRTVALCSLAGRQQCAGVVALDALHMHRAIPPGAQDLRYPARVARKLAVILHTMWIDGTVFCMKTQEATA
jgi:hypothetical protein